MLFDIYDAIIIGAGPAGMSAALYLLRDGKKVLILEKETIGGSIASTPLIENYPGVKAVSGSELTDIMFDQIDELGVEFELEEVTNINVLEEMELELPSIFEIILNLKAKGIDVDISEFNICNLVNKFVKLSL